MLESDSQFPDTINDVNDFNTYSVVSRSFNHDIQLQEVVTDQQIRACDPRGCGSFGAPRGDRTHLGVDIVTQTNQSIHSPISGKISRFPSPYSDDPKYTGVEIVDDNGVKIKMFYVSPTVKIGDRVEKGTLVGKSQDIRIKYANITNHIHFELYQNNQVLDASKSFSSKLSKSNRILKGVLIVSLGIGLYLLIPKKK